MSIAVRFRGRPPVPALYQAPVLLLFGWLIITMAWWGLAFFPDDGAPAWLTQVQVICFGRTLSGLPETYGWLVLVATPLSLLAGLLATYAADVRDLWPDLRADARFLLLAFVFAPLALAETTYIGSRIVEGVVLNSQSFAFDASFELDDSYPRTNRPAEPFSLIDQRGARVTLADYQGKKVALTFAFAHCSTMCPAIIRNTIDALDGLPADEVEAVFVTLDPWRDTPSSLPALSETWGLPKNAHILSGPVDDVVDVLQRNNMPFKRDEKTGDIAHPALLYVIDGAGQIAYTLQHPTVSTIREALARTR